MPLYPPSVKDAEVHYPVVGGLHPAGAGGLPGPHGRIQPYIDPGNKLQCEVHIVTLEINYLYGALQLFALPEYLLYVALAVSILGMGLSCINELELPFPYLQQTVYVPEKEACPLVCGSPP